MAYGYDRYPGDDENFDLSSEIMGFSKWQLEIFLEENGWKLISFLPLKIREKKSEFSIATNRAARILIAHLKENIEE